MADPLNDLPRLGADAMMPCIVCGKHLVETGLPIFFRIEAKQLGLNAQEIRRHVGLAMSMGGGEAGLVLADVLGPGVKPVVVMDTITPFNVCHACALDRVLDVLNVIGMQWEKDRQMRGLPVPPRGDEG